MTPERRLDTGVFIGFLRLLIDNQSRPIFLIVDGHLAHKAKKVQTFVASTRGRLRLYFLPPYPPDLNPDELVWNHVTDHKVGRTPVTDAEDLKRRAISALRSLKKLPANVWALFQAPSVQYAAVAHVR